MRSLRAALLCVMMVFVAACTQYADSTPQSGTPTGVVTIDGTSYTCEDLLGAYSGTCDSRDQYVLDTYGQNVERYVQSSTLGTLSTTPFTMNDRAFVGITTCALARDKVGYSGVIDRVFKVAPFRDIKHLQSSDLRPAWNSALKQLCPRQ